MAARLRVVSYNVLSPQLAPAGRFGACRLADLHGPTRLNRVLAKLDKQTQQGAIVCLQEVSMEWSGKIHSLFEQRDYSLVTASYGPSRSGFHGVAMAWPRAGFETDSVELVRLADTRNWPRGRSSQEREEACATPRRLLANASGWQGSSNPFRALLQSLGGGSGDNAPPAAAAAATAAAEASTSAPMTPAGPAHRAWVDEAKRRPNMAISAVLRPRGAEPTAGPFVVTTYHMPCVFWAPKVMVAHTALLLQHSHSVAQGLPQVVCGDFNFTPGSSSYNLITQGLLHCDHPDYPSHTPAPPGKRDLGREWTPHVTAPLASAYQLATGREPEFTNWTKTGAASSFVDTLDYIFVSGPGHWEVAGVLDLPTRRAGVGPLPSAKQPSDHIMIGATLDLLPRR